MKLITREFWLGHRMTVLVVKYWRPIYWPFNWALARATRRHEYAITAEGSALHTMLAREKP